MYCYNATNGNNLYLYKDPIEKRPFSFSRISHFTEQLFQFYFRKNRIRILRTLKKKLTK